MSLENLIKERIRIYGAISVAEYMDLCLAHPEYGYYMRRDPLGAKGDFITAPEISQIFGELLGLWIAAQWQKQQKKKAALVELGPGRGTLMVDALRATKKIAGFHEAISVHLVETSPYLKQKQWQILAGKHPDINWHENINSLPNLPLFIIANEFFDALPIEQYINGVKREISLNENNQLYFIPQISKEQQSEISEKSPAAISIIKTLSEKIVKQGGAALIIDYGYSELSRGDSLQAIKAHCYHDVLATPGEADITAHVDFFALKEAAKEKSAAVFGPLPQGKFLLQIGASQRLVSLCGNSDERQKNELMSGFERLISHEQMGELFKVMAILPPDTKQAEGF